MPQRHGRAASSGADADAATTYARHRPEDMVLFAALQQHWSTFVADLEASAEPPALPAFVLAEVEAFLRCGILAHGFVLARCGDCGWSRPVAFSCKRRGFCPSCIGRRMAGFAASLVDRVVPAVPVRQWVLTVPHALRARMMFDPGLTSAVLRELIAAVSSWLRRRARRLGVTGTVKTGAIAVIQRFNSAAAASPHFHTLVLDGVFSFAPGVAPLFHPTPAPRDEDVAHVVAAVCRRVERRLATQEPSAAQRRFERRLSWLLRRRSCQRRAVASGACASGDDGGTRGESRREHPEVAREVGTRTRDERDETLEQLVGREHERRSSVAPGALELELEATVVEAGQAIVGDGRAREVAGHTFEAVTIASSDTSRSLKVEAGQVGAEPPGDDGIDGDWAAAKADDLAAASWSGGVRARRGCGRERAPTGGVLFAGFGCLKCGYALCEYEHIDPEFKDAAEHDPTKMALLCRRCHGEVTARRASKESVWAAKKAPFCKGGTSNWGPMEFGELTSTFGRMMCFDSSVLLRVIGEDLLSIAPPEVSGGPIRVNAKLFDADRVALEIEDNMFSSAQDNWDVEIEGPLLTIRRAPGEPLLV